jgi:hypothetical protein
LNKKAAIMGVDATQKQRKASISASLKTTFKKMPIACTACFILCPPYWAAAVMLEKEGTPALHSSTTDIFFNYSITKVQTQLVGKEIKLQ